MAYFLHRATLLAHGGLKQDRLVVRTSWDFMQRLYAAKRLAKFAGLLSPGLSLKRNIQAIKHLEERLRYLEARGVVKIDNGIIHYVDKEIDFKDKHGRGVVDIAATFEKMLWEVTEITNSSTVNFRKNLEQNSKKLFRKVTDLDSVQNSFRRKIPRLKMALLHPLLHLEALDSAALKILKELSEKFSERHRMNMKNINAEAAASINMLEAKLEKIKEEPAREIRMEFNPHNHPPYTLKVYPIDQLSLLSETSEGKVKFVFVISDTHFGPELHPKTEELLRFYKMTMDLGGVVVHNGDYFDFWVWASRYFKVIEKNNWVMSAVQRQQKVIQIFGNHDEDLKKLAVRGNKLLHNIYLPPSGNYFEYPVYIEHGHQSDWHSREGLRRGRYIVKILTLLNRTFLVRWLFPNLVWWMELGERLWYKVKSWFTGRDEWEKYKKETVINRIRTVYKELSQTYQFSPQNPLIYIRGHDHGLGIWFTLEEIRRAVYEDPELNHSVRIYSSGSWKDEDSDFLVLDFTYPGKTYVYPFVFGKVHRPFIVFQKT